ncbi:MAG: hypothetical protein Satyrvirus11_13 [Satyrvirus sp.]|uniref:Glycosyltransferase n=1 Tax=Satyrvirus sp. TaxID=2487771 RepID=A0A3G5AGB1_9VIRU|nr:MAG: hypothetical protein Satyrvirus11_13 [Satyrvirus sp.]
MTSIKLICLLASHLNCIERSTHFDELLDIINNQSCEEKNIYISLSHDFNINIVNILKKIKTYGFNLLYSKEKLSQFQHYKNIMDNLTIDDEINTWILFSDDDDIWSIHRLMNFYYPLTTLEIPDICSYIKIVPHAKLSNNKIIDITEDNYVNYCVRFKYLKLFFYNVNDDILMHRYCDVFFVSFMCGYGARILNHVILQVDYPVYIWREVDYDRNCSPNYDDIHLRILNILDLFIARFHQNNDSYDVNKFISYIKYNAKTLSNDLSFVKNIFNKYSPNHCFRYKMPTYS